LICNIDVCDVGAGGNIFECSGFMFVGFNTECTDDEIHLFVVAMSHTMESWRRKQQWNRRGS
jgi:hypothetical protein